MTRMKRSIFISDTE